MMAIIPINVDRNVSSRDYEAALALRQLVVTSCFYTFQGEGPYAGWPAVFIRLAGCNIGAKLDCPWCDTRFNIADGYHMNQGELDNVLAQYPQAKLVVVTGGEPLLQWATLSKFIARRQTAEAMNVHYREPLQWQIETNGLLLRQGMVDEMHALRVTVVMSPKIPHNRDSYRELPPVAFAATDPGYPLLFALKYVVTADVASPYNMIPIQALVEARKGTPVYVSGMAVYKRPTDPGEVASIWDDTLIDQHETALNYTYAAKLALKHGLRVSYQTHLFGGVE